MSAMDDAIEVGARAMIECAEGFAGMDKDQRSAAIEAMGRAANTRERIEAVRILADALKQAWLKTQ